LQIGTSILEAESESKPFEDFVTIFYDNKLENKVFKDFQVYKKYIMGTDARAQTNFKIVFE
jgi:hypothetical protein